MDTVYIKGEPFVLVPKKDLFEPMAAMRFLVFWRDSFTCVYCGRSRFEERIKLNLDHLIPDGPYTFENLVTACAECNCGKGANRLSAQTLTDFQEVIRRNSRKFEGRTGCTILPTFSAPEESQRPDDDDDTSIFRHPRSEIPLHPFPETLKGASAIPAPLGRRTRLHVPLIDNDDDRTPREMV